jgi:hypothetical protein
MPLAVAELCAPHAVRRSEHARVACVPAEVPWTDIRTAAMNGLMRMVGVDKAPDRTV